MDCCSRTVLDGYRNRVKARVHGSIPSPVSAGSRLPHILPASYRSCALVLSVYTKVRALPTRLPKICPVGTGARRTKCPCSPISGIAVQRLRALRNEMAGFPALPDEGHTPARTTLTRGGAYMHPTASPAPSPSTTPTTWRVRASQASDDRWRRSTGVHPDSDTPASARVLAYWATASLASASGAGTLASR